LRLCQLAILDSFRTQPTTPSNDVLKIQAATGEPPASRPTAYITEPAANRGLAYLSYDSVVFGPGLVAGLSVLAGRANRGRFGALVDVPAVATIPLDRLSTLEDCTVGHAPGQDTIPLLVVFFDLSDLTEGGRDLGEALIAGDFLEIGIDRTPFQLLASSLAGECR